MAPKNQRFWLTTDEVSTVIDAPAEQLYDMVADLPRMGEWSPRVRGGRVDRRRDRARPSAPASSATTAPDRAG